MIEAPLGDLASWTEHLARVDLPVLRRTVARLDALRAEEETADARAIAAAIGDDPLMALRLFSHLARQRGARSSAEVSTVERALVMLGVGPFFRAFERLGTVEERLRGMPHAHAGLIGVLRRGQRAARFACAFAVWRNDVTAEEIVLAALLHDAAELLLWCFAPKLMIRIRNLQAADPALRSAAAQQQVLGVALVDLQLALAGRWRLPRLLAELMNDRHAANPRVRSVTLAVSLARHSSVNWSNPALPDDFRAIATLLSVTPEKARELAGAPAEAGAPA
jgi:HD-like signal output (HDOD) protein